MSVPQTGQDEVFKALASPQRRRMLDLLRMQSRTTGDLVQSFEMTRIGVMKHLDVLESAGLVSSRKEGRARWYTLDLVPLQRVYERWYRTFEAAQASRWLRFRDVVESSVSDSEPYALDIAQTIGIDAPRADVFAALLTQTNMWWGAPFVHPDAVDLVIDPVLGGQFREVLSDGGGILLAQVTALRPDLQLELTGRLHLGVATAVADMQLSDHEGGTRLKFTIRAVGAVPAEMVAGFQGGWNELLSVRLKTFVETGEIRGIAAKGEV